MMYYLNKMMNTVDVQMLKLQVQHVQKFQCYLTNTGCSKPLGKCICMLL